MPAEATPDEQGAVAYLRAWEAWAYPQDAQGVQAPSDQAVTGGHGECECGDCSGWTWAWAEWAATRG